MSSFLTAPTNIWIGSGFPFNTRSTPITVAWYLKPFTMWVLSDLASPLPALLLQESIYRTAQLPTRLSSYASVFALAITIFLERLPFRPFIYMGQRAISPPSSSFTTTSLSSGFF